MITLYARKEPTTSQLAMQCLPAAEQFDVCLYTDSDCKELKARYSAEYTFKPDRRNRYVMLNCWKWRIVWVQ